MKIVFDEITTKKSTIEINWGGNNGTATVSDFAAAKKTGVDIPKGVADLGTIKIAGMKKLKYTTEQNQQKAAEAAQYEEAEKVAAIKKRVGGGTFTDDTNSTYKFAAAPEVATCDMKWSGGTTTFNLTITSKNVTMTYKSGAQYPYSKPMTYNFAENILELGDITLTRAVSSEDPYYPPTITLHTTDARQ